MRLNNAPAVIRMAAELSLPWRLDPVGEIVRFCVSKIEEWLSEAPPIHTLSQLEQLVCDRLQLRFEEFQSDAELRSIVTRYTKAGEPVFQQLLDDFDSDTFGTLLMRRAVGPSAADLYVAVIDCRGAKASRRFFTRWHEIAHLLTMVRQLELPYHRSTKKPPTERLMDHIAGEIGFFPALFLPALGKILPRNAPLTFAAVEAVRQEFCPTASFHSTLIACARYSKTPIIHVEAGLGLKKEEAQFLASQQRMLFKTRKPQPKLRALIAASNDAARAVRFRIDRNMSVPPSSVIARVFNGTDDTDATATERLELWRHSNGRPVGVGPIQVEARLVQSHVIALVQPLRVPSRRRSLRKSSNTCQNAKRLRV